MPTTNVDENPGIALEKPMTEARKNKGLRHEAQGKSMNRQIIDMLLEKAKDSGLTLKSKKTKDALLNKDRSYPKVEEYLRNLDHRRIDNDEDVPVTRREKLVRQADENSAKKFEDEWSRSHPSKKRDSKVRAEESKNQSTNKEPDAYKSEESDLMKSIDALLEKAYYGVGARQGRISVEGSHTNPKNHGKVTKPALSEERKKEIIEGSRKKALTQAEMGGLYGQAAKIRAEKSLDERTVDLVKSLNKDLKGGYGREYIKQTGKHFDEEHEDLYQRNKKFREKNPGIKPVEGHERAFNEMTEEIKFREKHAKKSLDERTVDLVKALNVDYGPRKSGVRRDNKEDFGIKRGPADKGKYIPGSKKYNNPQDSQDPKIRYRHKSLDERTCDLHKGFAPEKVGGAVGREYIKNPDSDKAKRVAVKFHSKNVNNPEAKEKFGEGMTEEIWQHNLKLAKKSLRGVVNMWQTDSAFMTKGSRAMPLGPGGEVQNLVKNDDEDQDNGAE